MIIMVIRMIILIVIIIIDIMFFIIIAITVIVILHKFLDRYTIFSLISSYRTLSSHSISDLTPSHVLYSPHIPFKSLTFTLSSSYPIYRPRIFLSPPHLRFITLAFPSSSSYPSSRWSPRRRVLMPLILRSLITCNISAVLTWPAATRDIDLGRRLRCVTFILLLSNKGVCLSVSL